jgi:arylsulfatase B
MKSWMLAIAAAGLLAVIAPPSVAARPNVILIITDDQGYGDLAAHGNPRLQTPHLDRLYRQSVRLTDFHVDPTCSPTRSALLSGRYSTRTGVWHTHSGRSLMATDELTLAEIFRASGYRTAMFGKWHLGDAYPLRPLDQGFERGLWHGGGGITQTPDYWGNDYFDDHYWLDGEPQKYEGYCTDVWFAAAQSFIDEHREEPFFVYLATNAPHAPYRVPERYRAAYDDVPSPTDAFLGMIANIDENIGRLLDYLSREKLLENTLLIWMTDNGTAQGEQIYDAGMRGKKGSEYDGGHRVPCFWYWPAGGIGGGRDVARLTAHFDIRPTLVELCELTEPVGPATDGRSLAGLLHGGANAWPERTMFVHSQRVLEPQKWRKTAVMTERWRLVNGTELFEIAADAVQAENVAARHPDVVQRLRAAYDRWWDSLADARQRTVATRIGDAGQPAVQLTAHDWLNEIVPVHQTQIAEGFASNGPWAIEVARTGTYEVTFSRWPLHLHKPLAAVTAGLTVQGHRLQQSISAEADRVVFQVPLVPGQVRLEGYLTDAEGQSRGPYYLRIQPWVERAQRR